MATNNFDNIFASGNIEASGNFIGAKAPTLSSHLANKEYVDRLDSKIAELNQDIITKPDNAAFRAYMEIQEQRIDTLQQQYDLILKSYRTLESLYTNLFLAHKELEVRFETYTGSV